MSWNHEDVIELFVSEKGYEKEEAKRLVMDHSHIVVSGMMCGPMALRATAMAIELQVEREKP